MAQIGIYNPTDTDFSCTYDIDGTYQPETYHVRAGQIAYFDPPLAKHIKKHLADTIFNERGSGSRSVELVYEDIYKEIDVT